MNYNKKKNSVREGAGKLFLSDITGSNLQAELNMPDANSSCLAGLFAKASQS